MGRCFVISVLLIVSDAVEHSDRRGSGLPFRRLTSTIVDYRTANLQNCILYIYSTNIGTEYFKHGVYSPLFPL